MDVTVIVPARNAERTLPDCLEALWRQTYRGGRVQLIAVDDGSDDGTAEAARRSGAEVIQIPPSGPAAARNRGAAAARGEVLLFTDADCAPDPDWIENMVRPFGDPAVTGTKGIYRTRQKEITARFVQAEYESRYRRMRRRRALDFVDTYSAGFRRALFLEAGGFDESFPGASVEDQEFSFRYSRLGGRLVLVSSAVVLHLHADNPWRYFRKKFRIGYWKTRVLARHPDKIISDAHTPPSVKLEMLAVLAMIAAGPFLFFGPGFWILLPALGLFAASALPFAAGLLRRDPRLAGAAPYFLLLRALGLGLGSAAGALAGISWLIRRPPPVRGDATGAPARVSRRQPEAARAEEVHETVH
jgi:glycosyltransferase involved in cell wall biosynthesis